MRGHVTVYGNRCRPNIPQIRCVSFGTGQTCQQKAKFIQNDIATVALFLVEWTSFLRNLANFELGKLDIYNPSSGEGENCV